MFRISLSLRKSFSVAWSVACLLCILNQTQVAHAWGSEGHRLINRLAATSLPASVPAFLRSSIAANQFEYLGPEPDRWRSEKNLNAAQAQEHFLDMELADALGPLPHHRMDFEAAVFAAKQRPEKVGLLPWQADEVWERLVDSLREYRALKAAKKNTLPVQQAIIFYAAWLGHYVGDGSQPLHATVQYNGWTGPNPNGYTTSHDIHWQFESLFVKGNIRSTNVRAKMTPAKAINGDMFEGFVSYLRNSGSNVEKLYQLEKVGGFTGTGTPESRAFTEERLAAGASMLRDMIYSAWLESAKPLPDSHAGQD